MNFDASASYKKDYSEAGEYRRKTLPVGSFAANQLGLHYMAGNVWEWCWDWYDAGYYANSPAADPKGPSFGVGRVWRGGSWGDVPAFLRTSDRDGSTPDYRRNFIGFRLARTR